MKPKSLQRAAQRRRKAKQVALGGSCIEQGLPLACYPPEGEQRHKAEVADRLHYLEHRRRHLDQHPDYERTWERPTPETARKVYDLVRVHVPELSTIHPDPVTAMQLITVALDVAVVSARYGRRLEERQGLSDQEILRRVKRAVTRNVVTDAIMRRWSDHARLARKEGRAYSVSQMTERTAKNAWRDLLVQDIHVSVLWETLIKHSEGRAHPLFHARGAKQIGEGYDIILHHGPTLRAFEKLVQKDAAYKHSRVSHALRLWIVGEDPPPVDHSDPICAEREYNKVTIGPRTQAILDIQERVQLLFDAPRFVADYKRVRAARKNLWPLASSFIADHDVVLEGGGRRPNYAAIFPLLGRLRPMDIFLLEFRSIYEQVRRERAPVKVQSEFYKILNRRYQNAHFFPMQASAKRDKPLPDIFKEAAPRSSEFWDIVSTSRTRWFSVPSPSGPQPLVSMDVSASQTQIQAILFSNAAMEQDSFGPRPHKEKLAERAWAARSGGAGLPNLIVQSPDNPDGYEDEKDPRLHERMKNLWMLRGYGPLIQGIMRDQAKKPELYGPGWRERATVNGPKLDVRGITLLLATVPGWIEREQFLTACKIAACHLIDADPYAGATLLDPFDGSTFTWNKPLMAADRLSLNKWEITLVKPGSYRQSDRIGRYLDEVCSRCGHRGKLRGSHWRCRNRQCGRVWQGTFRPAPARADGALQVDDDKLRKMLAPCIIHVLDSLFSSLVMEKLVEDGVTEVFAIHDCWYTSQTVHHADGREPEDGHVVINRAIKDAGKPWLLALGPVYQWLLDNVGGKQIEEAHRKWLARVERGNQGDQSAWPHFFAVPGKQDPAGPLPLLP